MLFDIILSILETYIVIKCLEEKQSRTKRTSPFDVVDENALVVGSSEPYCCRFLKHTKETIYGLFKYN